MARSSGSYLQGLQYAEGILQKAVSEGQEPRIKFSVMLKKNEEPDYYYDGKDFCEGFYDYINHYLDNEKLILEHAKVIVEFKNEA